MIRKTGNTPQKVPVKPPGLRPAKKPEGTDGATGADATAGTGTSTSTGALDATPTAGLDADKPKSSSALERQAKIVVGGDTAVHVTPSAKSAGHIQLAMKTSLRSFEPDTKEGVRKVRDGNMDALIGRMALDLVNGESGVWKKLNPQGLPLPGAHGHDKTSVEQRYQLIDAVRRMALAGADSTYVRELASRALENARKEGAPGPVAGAAYALESFSKAAAFLEQRADNYVAGLDKSGKLPAGMSVADAKVALQRFARLHWLEQSLDQSQPTASAHSGTTDLLVAFGKLCATGKGPQVLESLDARYEAVLKRMGEAQLSPTAQGQVKAIGLNRQEPSSVSSTSAALDERTLPLDHDNHQKLDELRARLDRGEKSAIGGADYPLQRFPEEVLRLAARGELHVLVYDGAIDNAVDYIKQKYGQKPDGSLQGSRSLSLQGLDGSGPRELLILDDNQKFLVVAGVGESRQLHNAGGLLLFQDGQGRRIPKAKLELAKDPADVYGRMKLDIEKAIREDNMALQGTTVLGVKVNDAQQIPTQLLVVQNPAHLKIALDGKVSWSQPMPGALIPFEVGVMKGSDGNLTRLCVPKVGGNGVYGDSAGKFVSAFLNAKMAAQNPDVIFNGTAGGFADTAAHPDFQQGKIKGLGAVKPGGIIMPLQSIQQAGGVPMPMSTLMSKVNAAVNLLTAATQPLGNPSSKAGDYSVNNPLGLNLQKAFANASVNFTDRHVAVKAPAVETYEMVDELIQQGNASIDVEGGAIMAAIEEVRKRRPNVTFTPVYTHSDDPRSSKHDRYDSLAMMGPFFEGSRFDEKLFGVLTALLDESQRRDHAMRGNLPAGESSS